VIVPVTAPTDRRFLRAQVKPGRRHAPWRRWIHLARVLVTAGLLAAAGWWGAMVVVGAPALRVEHLTVRGTQHLSSGEVLALLDGLCGSNILFVDLEDWRQKVLGSPWVAGVTLRRALPRSVDVIVTERHPIAISRVGEELFLIDEHGGVIDEYGPRYADFDLPILDGLAPGKGPDSAANDRRVELAARLLSDVKTRPELARRISQVDVSDPRNAVVIVDQETARVRLGEERFLERLQAYLEMAPALREQVTAIDYVDLRFGERWVVGAQGSVGRARTAAAAAPRRPGTFNQ
jgi:cell division protein FtsQ